MAQSPHEIAAVYPDRQAAETAFEYLTDNGYAADRLVLLRPHDLHADAALEPDGEGVRRHLVHDIFIGSGAGAAAGAAASVAGYVVTEATLFVAAPVLAPLLAVAYAASVGGLLGGAAGLRVKHELLSGLVKDALEHDRHVLLIYAPDETQGEIARQLVSETLADEEGYS